MREFVAPQQVKRIREYLARIGGSSLPTYEPLALGSPNFHRLNADDERSIVRGCFHQFSFFPWNQDVFELFALMRPLFMVKNVLSGNPPERFLGRQGEHGVAARLAFQFYPQGSGFLNLHRDPVGSHQQVVPTVSFSQKGVDFHEGGAFLVDRLGARHDLDALLQLGDCVLFDASTAHGIDVIDPTRRSNWLDFAGRWSLLIATNKLVGNTSVADAVDLEK